MNSKPQQIKMQSTKKGPLTKREEGGAQAGVVAVSPAVADEAVSAGATPAAPLSAQQPQSKAGGGGRRRGGQRHKVKSQGAILTPAGGC